jgi:undecaprenyl-diphosphatase
LSHSLLRFTRRGPARVDAWILAAFLGIALLLGAFFVLGSEVLEGETLAFDRWLLLNLRSAYDTGAPMGPQWLLPAMVDFTSLGGVAVLTLLTILAGGFLFATRRPGLGVFVLVAVSGGALVSTILKSLFLRARPDIVQHLVQVDSASFPSGHAMNAAIVYLTLGALLARSLKDRSARIYLLVMSIVLTVLIGFSRVYLGVHWPTDVIAGWAVGAAWAAMCSLVAQVLQRRAAIEPESHLADGAQ